MIDFMRRAGLSIAFSALVLRGTCAAWAGTPALLVDADSGVVLHQEEATTPWYPASLTKLMTVYVALKAIKDGKVSPDQPLLVSVRAARMPPSKMGFRPGTIITLDNALKMLMVKSANDLAVTVAEGVGGSVEDFATQMNASAQALGMRESNFVNPNGLPDPRQVSSARDLAVVARALLNEFPEHRGLFNIGALQLGRLIIYTHNSLIGRYPGADGMKTGFTCAAGWNLVASATRGNRRLISIVLGSPTPRERNQQVANLLDAGFAGTETGTATLESLAPVGGGPPDRHEETCTRHARAPQTEELPETIAAPPAPTAKPAGVLDGFGANVQPAPPPATAAPVNLLSVARPVFQPIHVYLGPAPGWTGPIPGGRRGRGPADLPTAYAPDSKRDAKSDAAAAAAAAAGPAQLSHARGLRRGRTIGRAPVKAKVKAVVRQKPKVLVKSKHAAK